MVTRLDGRNALIGYPGGNASLDSDCEGDSAGVGDGVSQMKEEEEKQARAVLTTGSLSAYVHPLFCLCLEK